MENLLFDTQSSHAKLHTGIHCFEVYLYLAVLSESVQSLRMTQTIDRLSRASAYLDNIAILDNCSQKLPVFRFILFLFQIGRMLKCKEEITVIGIKNAANYLL